METSAQKIGRVAFEILRDCPVNVIFAVASVWCDEVEKFLESKNQNNTPSCRAMATWVYSANKIAETKQLDSFELTANLRKSAEAKKSYKSHSILERHAYCIMSHLENACMQGSTHSTTAAMEIPKVGQRIMMMQVQDEPTFATTTTGYREISGRTQSLYDWLVNVLATYKTALENGTISKKTDALEWWYDQLEDSQESNS